MLVSIVVPEKLARQKRCDEEEAEEEDEFLGVFDVFVKYPRHDYLQLFDVYVFTLWRTAH